MDDSSLQPGKFMSELCRIFSDPLQEARLPDVYACSSSTSDRMEKQCKEVGMKFIAKPISKQTL